MNETSEKVIEAAERMIREGGYHSFSFRQIADDLGVKSASIHYHFPTKEALGEAVAVRYTESFLEVLGDPAARKDPLAHYISCFQASLKADGRACLCGVLAAECGRLPQSIRDALEQFTKENLAWLEKAIKVLQPKWTPKKAKETALVIFSALEGAITFAALTENEGYLAQVGKVLRAGLK